MLTFELLLVPPVSSDVVKRHLDVTIVGGDSFSLELAADVTVVRDERMIGVQDTAVTVSLTDEDDVGNRSETATVTLALLDTIAPAAPGAVVLRATSEFEPAPAPAPEEPAPAPAPEEPAPVPAPEPEPEVEAPAEEPEVEEPEVEEPEVEAPAEEPAVDDEDPTDEE